MLRSPEYFLSYVLLPEKGQDNSAISCSCQSLGWEEYFFLLTSQILQSHCFSVTTGQRIKQGDPQTHTKAIISGKIQMKVNLEFFLPTGKLSLKKGWLPKGKICYKWDKIHGTEYLAPAEHLENLHSLLWRPVHFTIHQAQKISM